MYFANDALVMANTLLQGTRYHNFEFYWNSEDHEYASSTDSIYGLLTLDGETIGEIVVSVYIKAKVITNSENYTSNVVFIDHSSILENYQGHGLSRLLLLLPYSMARFINADIISMDVATNKEDIVIKRYTRLYFINGCGELFDAEDIEKDNGLDFNNRLPYRYLDMSEEQLL